MQGLSLRRSTAAADRLSLPSGDCATGADASAGWRLLGRVAFVFLIFAVLTLPALFAGHTRSPAVLALAGRPVPPTVAFIGDSRIHTDVSPRLVLGAVGTAGLAPVDGYNFGVGGSDASHHRSFVALHLLS